MYWKVGDWAIFELDIVQIKDIREHGNASVSEGSIETNGMILDRLRPLTLENKRTIEYFDYHYQELRKINGERGFNYPDIHRYFVDLARRTIDYPKNTDELCTAAREFIKEAKEYKPIIQGINLFRRNI